MSGTTDAVYAELQPYIEGLLKRHDATAISVCLLNEGLKLTVLALSGNLTKARELIDHAVASWFRDLAPHVAEVLTNPPPTKKEKIH